MCKKYKKLRCYMIFGIIFTIAVGSLMHYAYEWSGNSFIIGLIAPVNESTWEHMKLCFFPMLLYSFYMNRKMKEDNPCITSSLLFGILLGTFLIPVIFYTYSGIIGKNYIFLDIATFIISILLAFISVYRLTLSCKISSFSFGLKICVLFVAVCFLIFTYYPPDIGIFMNPSK